jgi:thiosulfate/3-mercaptopyruvate sulfurtransferase
MTANDHDSSMTAGQQHPTDVLVSPEWVNKRLPRLESADADYRLVEVDVNSEFYRDSHLPGAVELNWQTDLRAAASRDIIGPAELERVLGAAGISEETTIIAYGDNANWFATHFYWMMSYYGHPDVRIMDGGREYWEEHEYPMTDVVPDPVATDYAVQARHTDVRVYRDDVRAALETTTKLIDVRSHEEYTGAIAAPPGTRETAQRGGHIPGAYNIFWAENIRPDRRFKSPAQLQAVYDNYGLSPVDTVITYCRIGERSAVTWFVLHELLGYGSVANYDGSWVEWGNMIRAPIATGDDRGSLS